MKKFRSHDVPISTCAHVAFEKRVAAGGMSFEIGANFQRLAVLDRVVTDSAVNVTFGLIDQLLDRASSSAARVSSAVNSLTAIAVV